MNPAPPVTNSLIAVRLRGAAYLCCNSQS
jgi:hypothetical protein